jgi:hypothetical protein
MTGFAFVASAFRPEVLTTCVHMGLDAWDTNGGLIRVTNG